MTPEELRERKVEDIAKECEMGAYIGTSFILDRRVVEFGKKLAATFAESLSGGTAANREFDISVRCGHCNTINYAVRSLAELEVNERGAVPPAASPQPEGLPIAMCTCGAGPVALDKHEPDCFMLTKRAASGSGTPATPSAPDKLYRRIPAGENFPHGLLQEVDISTQIAAAVAAEREECAKIAEQYLDAAFCRGSFYGEQVAAAIRSRASQPAQQPEGR